MAKSRSGQKRRASTAKAAAQAKQAPPGPAQVASAAVATATREAAVQTGPPGGSRTGPARQPARGAARQRQRSSLERSPLGVLAARLGLPPLGLLLGVGSWLIVLLLWGTAGVGGGFAVFLGALLTAAVAMVCLVASTARETSILEAMQAGVVLLLAVAIPVVFDPHTVDVFNLPRYTLVVVGALALAGLTAVAGAHERRAPTWRNGLQWPIAAVVAWTIVSALASKDVNVSLLGNYGSYDGLYATLAFATVAMATAGTIRAAHVRNALGALAFAGGSVVVLYGLIQFHDTEFGGHLWDFIHWHDASFANQIFSTFGNPNHLAGYLAIILPTIAVVGLRAKHRWVQVVAALFGLATLLEILRSAARGAWVAVIASGVVLLVALAPELKRRPKLSFAGLGGLLVVVAAGMAAFGNRLLHVPLSSLFQSGGTSPVEQRFQIWHQAALMAAHHPLTGIGPDTFALVYPQHQSAAWVKGLGPNYTVNGAHDIFMNALADQGFVGLLVFVGLLAFLGFRSIGAWRRLRSAERAATADAVAASAAREQRLTLAVIAAGITAYVVQAVFNVQQIGLSFSFWLLVGLLAVTTRAAGVPDTLRPRRLLAPSRFGPLAIDEEPAPAEAPTSSPRRYRRPARTFPWVTAVAAVAATALVVVLSLGTDGPWRADHAYWAASTDLHAASTASRSGTAAGNQQAARLSVAYSADMTHAMALNPWEPQYPGSEASVLVNSAAQASSATIGDQDLAAARTLYAQAMTDEPLGGQYAENEAVVDVDLARTSAATKASYLAAAVTAARRALRDNPLDAAYQRLLASVQADQRTGATNA